MRVSKGRDPDGLREWTQFGFRFKGKNHALVIQKNDNGNLTRPWWYTYHLEGRGQDDPIYTIQEAPLSRYLAEDFARQYIREYLKQGEPVTLIYDITHKKKIRILDTVKGR